MVVTSLLPLILMDKSKNVVESVSGSMFHCSEPNLLICCLNVFHEESGMLVEYCVVISCPYPKYVVNEAFVV